MSYKKQDSFAGSEARKAFRQTEGRRAVTEYEEEQRALQKNFERLKAERLQREAAKSKPTEVDLTKPRS